MQRSVIHTGDETKSLNPSFYKMAPGIKTLDYGPKDLIKDVADYFKISVYEIKSTSRKREFVLPRQIAMYYITKHFNKISYATIGSMFQGKDHATVTHSISVVENLKITDKNYCYNIKELGEIIDSHILKIPEGKK